MMTPAATQSHEHPTTNSWLCRLAYHSRGMCVAPAIGVATIAALHAHPPAVDLAVGSILFLLGWGGRLWAQRHLGYRLPYRMRLTSCGPYRFMRNPIYVANTLIVTGTTLVAGSPRLAIGAALLCAAVYSLTVHHEEGHLTRRYGRRYLAYCEATPRWLPLIPSPPAATACTCARHWTEIALAEWHVPLILVPVVVSLLIR
jgi:protein-S-isoprenylcysteine O-methyltransferase Ste14